MYKVKLETRNDIKLAKEFSSHLSIPIPLRLSKYMLVNPSMKSIVVSNSDSMFATSKYQNISMAELYNQRDSLNVKRPKPKPISKQTSYSRKQRSSDFDYTADSGFTRYGD